MGGPPGEHGHLIYARQQHKHVAMRLPSKRSRQRSEDHGHHTLFTIVSGDEWIARSSVGSVLGSNVANMAGFGLIDGFYANDREMFTAGAPFALSGCFPLSSWVSACWQT